ncbi:MAG: GNAT family N-acetyltransferase [Vicinamibacteraceae bacterium]
MIGRKNRELLVAVDYQLEPNLQPDEFIDILVRSTLSERRPVDQPDVIRAMLTHADIIVTARVGGQLAGVSRAMSDFSYCTYLSDLAVDQEHQGRGIGRELIRRTHEAGGVHTQLILLAAPKARSYYPHIGMQPHDSCWIIPRRQP